MSAKTKSLTTANAAFANTILQQLEGLSARRDQWEKTDYKKANDGLYALLAECLEVFNAHFVKGSADDQVALRRSLIVRLQANRIRVVKTSTTLTMLVRFVFNNDRKRAQVYGYVLAAAVSHKVSAGDFPNWVVQQGGIEQVKQLMVKKPEAIAKQAAVEAAKLVVSNEVEQNVVKPLARVNLGGLSGNYAVLLVKPNLGGGADVVGSLSDVNESLFHALIQRMAKAKVQAQADQKELLTQTQRESRDLLATSSNETFCQVING